MKGLLTRKIFSWIFFFKIEKGQDVGPLPHGMKLEDMLVIRNVQIGFKKMLTEEQKSKSDNLHNLKRKNHAKQEIPPTSHDSQTGSQDTF